jgi:dolichol-phosphate mannosyltransferase
MTKTNNPLFYFGSVGSLSTLAGLTLGGWVAYRWFVFNVSHEVIAFLAGVAILFGVQLLMFGVLSDMIVAVNREQSRQLQRLAEQLHEDSTRDSSGSVSQSGTMLESDSNATRAVDEETDTVESGTKTSQRDG